MSKISKTCMCSKEGSLVKRVRKRKGERQRELVAKDVQQLIALEK